MYGGIDQLTGKRIQLRETVKARDTQRETETEAEKVHVKLLNQVDERRSPQDRGDRQRAARPLA